MRTHFPDGRAFGPGDLVSTFAIRITAIQQLAEGLDNVLDEEKPAPRYLFRALAFALSELRDDFDLFEEALGVWRDDPDNLRRDLQAVEEEAKRAAAV